MGSFGGIARVIVILVVFLGIVYNGVPALFGSESARPTTARKLPIPQMEEPTQTITLPSVSMEAPVTQRVTRQVAKKLAKKAAKKWQEAKEEAENSAAAVTTQEPLSAPQVETLPKAEPAVTPEPLVEAEPLAPQEPLTPQAEAAPEVPVGPVKAEKAPKKKKEKKSKEVKPEEPKEEVPREEEPKELPREEEAPKVIVTFQAMKPQELSSDLAPIAEEEEEAFFMEDHTKQEEEAVREDIVPSYLEATQDEDLAFAMAEAALAREAEELLGERYCPEPVEEAENGWVKRPSMPFERTSVTIKRAQRLMNIHSLLRPSTSMDLDFDLGSFVVDPLSTKPVQPRLPVPLMLPEETHSRDLAMQDFPTDIEPMRDKMVSPPPVVQESLPVQTFGPIPTTPAAPMDPMDWTFNSHKKAAWTRRQNRTQWPEVSPEMMNFGWSPIRTPCKFAFACKKPGCQFTHPTNMPSTWGHSQAKAGLTV